MAVRIAQASINEKGTIAGGIVGDQTGHETNVSPYYNGGWTLVIRPVDNVIAERMAQAAEYLCQTASVGYAQDNRNDLYKKLKKLNWNYKMLNQKADADCSSLMTACAACAGVNMEPTLTAGNAAATFQMRTQWAKVNEFTMLTDAKYLKSSDYLRRGDVLVNESRHTIICLDDGPNASGKNSSIIINGKEYPIDRQLIGGRNFFQIREIVDIFNRAGVTNLEVGNKGSIAVLTSK